MEAIKRKLEYLTNSIIDSTHAPTSKEGLGLQAELRLLQELSKTVKVFDNVTLPATNSKVKQRLSVISKVSLGKQNLPIESSEALIDELKTLQLLMKTWEGFNAADMESLNEKSDGERKSAKTWDAVDSEFTTMFTGDNKLTSKQRGAMALLDDFVHDKVLLLGGSGSGKSFVEAYKIVRDTLRHKAPCLIARDKLVDLTQGMIDQIIPCILGLIAAANKQERWDTWTIDGLKFAKWGDKKTRLEFATGGYIRFAGLSARDLSESGSDKILSPSWLHVMLEEVSELEYEIVEKVLTRLRFHVDGILNKLVLCENPPSINHWTYKRFYEKKREDGTDLSDEELGQHTYLLMNPQDNVENLGDTYIRNLSQMTGANRERFFLGSFQDSETGLIFSKMQWTDNLPAAYQWERLVIYTDPTPLTGKEHSKWADYKASVLCGLFDNNTYVLDVRIIKGSTLDMLTNIKQLWDVSPNQSITDVLMEKKQVPSDFNQVLTTFSMTTGWMIGIKLDTRIFSGKKESIETFLQPMFENGTIFFNKAFQNTERGRQTTFQVLKFSRKANINVHDDIPDAIMRADTYMKGKKSKHKQRSNKNIVAFIKPGFIHK